MEKVESPKMIIETGDAVAKLETQFVKVEKPEEDSGFGFAWNGFGPDQKSEVREEVKEEGNQGGGF